jgi:hypothetical protein
MELQLNAARNWKEAVADVEANNNAFEDLFASPAFATVTTRRVSGGEIITTQENATGESETIINDTNEGELIITIQENTTGLVHMDGIDSSDLNSGVKGIITRQPGLTTKYKMAWEVTKEGEDGQNTRKQSLTDEGVLGFPAISDKPDTES